MSRTGRQLRLYGDGARGGADTQGRAMKYMLLMMAPAGGWAKFGTLPPEDIRALVHPTLRHRVLLGYRAEADGVTVDGVVDRLIEHVKGPIQ